MNMKTFTGQHVLSSENFFSLQRLLELVVARAIPLGVRKYISKNALLHQNRACGHKIISIRTFLYCSYLHSLLYLNVTFITLWMSFLFSICVSFYVTLIVCVLFSLKIHVLRTCGECLKNGKCCFTYQISLCVLFFCVSTQM